MGIRNANNSRSYAIGQPTVSAPLEDIVSKRSPTANDLAPISQVWVNTLSNQSYQLTSLVGNQATWTILSNGGGSGTFESVDITGNTGIVLQVATGGETSLGGDLEVEGVTTLGQTAIVGELAVTNQVTINSDGETISINGDGGDITISSDDEDANVFIAGGNAEKTVIIGSSTGASSLTLVAPVSEGVVFGDLTNFIKIIPYAGDPSGVLTAYKGSLCINVSGSTTTNRLYINTDSATGWASIETSV